MAREGLPEPWHSFLAEIDRAVPEPLELTCIGGFAVSLFYGLSRPTGDLDVVDVTPAHLRPWLMEIAGQGRALHSKHKVYVQFVAVADLPESYQERRQPMVPGAFNKLRLFVPDPYDLALSKLSRNLDLDLEDVKHLARAQSMDMALLEQRYREEFRPIAIGPAERHDRTLALWMDAILEHRGKR